MPHQQRTQQLRIAISHRASADFVDCCVLRYCDRVSGVLRNQRASKQYCSMASLSLQHACVRSPGAAPRVAPRATRVVAPFRHRQPKFRRAAVVAAAGGPFEELADRLGDEVHADLNGWRLYLRDMKAGNSKNMAQALAEEVGSGTDVEAALKKVTISMGGGKTELSLFDVVPSSGVNNAKNVVKDLDM